MLVRLFFTFVQKKYVLFCMQLQHQLCLHNETYIVCIAWSTVDLLLFGYIMLSHKTIKLPSLIIVQIIFAILWGYFFVITL